MIHISFEAAGVTWTYQPLTKASFSCKHLIKFILFIFLVDMIEALTARLGAVGHSSPTLVGEGLSDEYDSS